MNEISDFQQRAAKVAIAKMLTGTSFSICDFDAIAKLIGKDVGGLDYQALRTLHCVHWSDMGEQLAAQVRLKCMELLDIPTNIFDSDIHHHAPAEAPKENTPTSWLRRLTA